MIEMSKKYFLLGFGSVGALLLAAAELMDQDSTRQAPARVTADVSPGPSTVERFAYAPPSAESRDVRGDLSTVLLSGGLVEPPAGSQAIQPQPPSALVAAAKRGLGAENRWTSESTSVVERTIQPPRVRSDLPAAALAIEPLREGTGTLPFTSGPFTPGYRDDETLPQPSAPRQNDGSELALSPVAVPSSQPLSENSDRDTDTVAGVTGEATNGTGLSIENEVAAADTGVAQAPSVDDILPALTAVEMAPAGTRVKSGLSDGATGSPDTPRFRPDPASEGPDQEPEDQLASRPVESDPTMTPTVALETSEPKKQRETGSADTPPAVSTNTVIQTERLLDRLGFYPGPIDGVVGPMTLDAIASFQKQQGRETNTEINDQLVTALERSLFESFQQHLKTSGRQSSQRAPIEKSTKIEKSPPSGDAQPRKSVKIYGQRYQANNMQSRRAPSDAPKVAPLADKALPQIEAREEPRPMQQVRLQAPSEKVEEKAPNAFEACARSGMEKEYVKTGSGFVLCEEFSFDGGIRR